MSSPTNQAAVPLVTVLADELEEIYARRQWVAGKIGGTFEEPKPDNLIGLCFSGGGIRSATFNLGILQGLAQFRMLHCIDYLSTVSGGGYIGTWLAAWIKRRNVQEVEKFLSSEDSPDPNADDTAPIQFLRRYSNYLTPEVGLFSADTWTLIAIWLRNTMLNQLILIAFLSSLLLIPRWLDGATNAVRRYPWSIMIAVLALIPAAIVISQNMLSLDNQPRERKWIYEQGGIQTLVVVPVFVSAWIASACLWRFAEPHKDVALLLVCSGAAIGMFVFLSAVALAGKYFRCFEKYKEGGSNGIAVAEILAFALISALAGGALLWVIARDAQDYWPLYSWHVTSWGVPVMVAVFSLVIILNLGLLGGDFPDERREWWSRLGAWLFIYSIAWAGLFAVALYGPLLVVWLIDKYVVGAGASLAWIGSTIAGVVTGKSASTGKSATTGAKDTSHSAGLIAKVAPVIFIIGLLLALSFAIHLIALQFVCANASSQPETYALSTLFCHVSNTTGRTVLPDYSQLYLLHWPALSAFPPYWALLGSIGCFAIGFALSARIDINEFSLHDFYKNRLVRCYMGASRGTKGVGNRHEGGQRQPNPFTGIDPKDDLHLAKFSAKAEYTGPYPILNTALNLVHGEELAWQERKAESFVFTPRYCGYSVHSSGRATHKNSEDPDSDEHAYRSTLDYAYPAPDRRDATESGIHIGTAMAISGAAASPNMGAASSATSAFLLTMFDVRLGWWLGNTRSKSKWQKSDPNIGLFYLLAELTAQTNDKSGYVYLSDGGHFENLGVYELVRRRCRYIVVCDSEEDHAFNFGGLGNAIRKCRADFGVEIRVDVDRIRRDPETRKSVAHCVVGSIEYPRTNDHSQTEGVLVYIKSSLTGDEPSDVLEYAAREAEFPHQTTGDQWFDESQFESYRRLGLHVADDTFGRLSQNKIFLGGDKVTFFNKLKEQWYPPSPAIEKSFTRHTQQLDALMERLRCDKNLKFLDAQIYPEWKQLMQRPVPDYASNLWLPQTEEEMRSGFYFCNALIQTMENVYLDLKLDTDHNFEHPDNRGWINLFNHWVWSGMFRVTWAITGSTYGSRFQTFCENRLQAPQPKVNIELANNGPENNQLNFHEKELLRSPGVWGEGDKLYLLQLDVADIAEHKPKISFTFGFAVVNADQKIAYIRVQDHLRNMGLARRAIRELIKAPNSVRWGDKSCLRHPHERFGPNEPERLERLFKDLEPKPQP